MYDFLSNLLLASPLFCISSVSIFWIRSPKIRSVSVSAGYASRGRQVNIFVFWSESTFWNELCTSLSERGKKIISESITTFGIIMIIWLLLQIQIQYIVNLFISHFLSINANYKVRHFYSDFYSFFFFVW